jgi:hypothetical protein
MTWCPASPAPLATPVAASSRRDGRVRKEGRLCTCQLKSVHTVMRVL